MIRSTSVLVLMLLHQLPHNNVAWTTVPRPASFASFVTSRPGRALHQSPMAASGDNIDDVVESADGRDQSALAQRLAAGFGPTVWTEFGSMAASLDDVVNLGQGFPDFAPPEFVRDAARAAINLDCHQYTRPAGHPPLVKLLAQRYSKHLGREVDPMAEVAVTVGCSQALYVTMQCLLKPGDEVVLLEPFFDLYIGQIRMAGGTPKYVPLRATPDADAGWALDVDLLRAAMGPRTRALVLNSPHNPTGKVFGREEMELIAEVLREWPQVTVVSDEVYKYTVHGGGSERALQHVHFASLPGMFDRTLTLSSAGKTFSVTGWQIGWIVGPSKLVRDVHIALPFLQFCASVPMQQAMVGVLEEAEKPYGGKASYYEWLCAQYRRKAVLLASALEAAQLPVLQSEGGYFLTVDVSGIPVPQKYLDEVSPATGGKVTHDWAFCRWLAIEHGVLSIPVAPFFSPERRGEAGAFARFAFCKTDETLNRAAERLASIPAVLADASAPAPAVASAPLSSSA